MRCSFWQNKRQIGVLQEISEMWTVLESKILGKEWIRVSSGVTRTFFFPVFLQEVRKVGWLTDVMRIIAINVVLALMCLLMVLVLSHCTANFKSSKITSFSNLLFLGGTLWIGGNCEVLSSPHYELSLMTLCVGVWLGELKFG